MPRTDLTETYFKNRKSLEKTLATAKRGLTLTEVASLTKLPVSTVKGHLDKMLSIGAIDLERYGSFNVYKFNGKGRYRDTVRMSDNHILFIDAMINKWGNPFIRIKQSKKSGNDWNDVGAIILNPRNVHELATKLRDVSRNIESGYGE